MAKRLAASALTAPRLRTCFLLFQCCAPVSTAVESSPGGGGALVFLLSGLDDRRIEHDVGALGDVDQVPVFFLKCWSAIEWMKTRIRDFMDDESTGRCALQDS